MKYQWPLQITFIVLFFLGCAHKGLKPDSDITEEWLKPPYENSKSTIPTSDAKAFLNHFFVLLDQVIFDPTYRSNDLAKVKKELLADIASGAVHTREDLIKAINKKFKDIHFSHLAVLDPEKSLKIMKMAGGQKDETPEPSVSAKMKGKVGIIRVSSFLVPSITLTQVNEARRKVQNAKYLIYDLRDNGGGSVSSVSYLIESILGPGQTILFSRTREGLATKSPITKEGYFPDESNPGSNADIEFEKQNNYTEWKTRKEATKDNRPTIVIVNSHCGSSCDIFSAAVKESKAATIVGTKTAGAVLGAVAYKLDWKAHIAILPVSQVISPQGNLYEGIGIKPDIEIKRCEDAKDVKCIDEAIRHFSK